MKLVIHFDINKLESELKEYEKQTTNPDFWSDSKTSSLILKKITSLKSKIEEYKKIKSEFNITCELNELLSTENDEELEKELVNNIKKIDRYNIYPFIALLIDSFSSSDKLYLQEPFIIGLE